MTPIEPLNEPLNTMQREAKCQKEFSSIRSLAFAVLHGHRAIRQWVQQEQRLSFPLSTVRRDWPAV